MHWTWEKVSHGCVAYAKEADVTLWACNGIYPFADVWMAIAECEVGGVELRVRHRGHLDSADEAKQAAEALGLKLIEAAKVFEG